MTINVGRLWIRGACTPWRSAWHCDLCRYTAWRDWPITYVCPFCGEAMRQAKEQA